MSLPTKVKPTDGNYGPGIWVGDDREKRNDRYDTFGVYNPKTHLYDLHHNGYLYPAIAEADLMEILEWENLPEAPY